MRRTFKRPLHEFDFTSEQEDCHASFVPEHYIADFLPRAWDRACLMEEGLQDES